MPLSTRRSVVFPDPLFPTRPTRSPRANSNDRSDSAWTTTRVEVSRARRPPVVARTTALFNERRDGLQMGNSTQTPSAEMCAIFFYTQYAIRARYRENIARLTRAHTSEAPSV